MRLRLSILVIPLLLLVNTNFSYTRTQRYHGQTIADIVRLPESEIDIGLACLVLAKEAYPDIDINAYLDLLDRMAFNIGKIAKGSEDPEARIGALNTFLYRPGRWNGNITYEYDLDDLEAKETKNKYLNGYLNTQKGSCITMPMLYIVLAQRLGWPVYAVCSPMHFFCRYIAEDFKKNNIEPTVGGGFSYDLDYVMDTDVPKKAIDNGVYLRTLTNKEYIGRLLTINAFFHYQNSETDKAISYLTVATKLDSTCSDAYWNLGISYFMQARQLKNKMESELRMVDISALATAPTKIDNHLIPREGFEHDRVAFERRKIHEKYVPQINQFVQTGKSYRKEAEELGIVLEFPAVFFKKQAESINEFIRKGGY